MSGGRPAKAVVRRWWLEVIRERVDEADADGRAVYLTLPGAEGIDIQMMIDDGLLELEEGGPIAAKHAHRVLALEKDMLAYSALKDRFPGLKVRRMSVKELIAGENVDAFPTRDDRQLCRAAVVNLDYQSPYMVAENAQRSALIAVDKFQRMHQAGPDRSAIPWTLCLTLNGDLAGPIDEQGLEIAYLEDKLRGSPSLAAWASVHLVDVVDGGSFIAPPIHEWPAVMRQNFLLLLVPLRLIHLFGPQDWEVRVRYAARYGGGADGAAPMVTFVADLQWDRTMSTDSGRYSACQDLLIQSTLAISDDGTTVAMTPD
jgi:hypothetical protein